jgi:hypothetical protein
VLHDGVSIHTDGITTIRSPAPLAHHPTGPPFDPRSVFSQWSAVQRGCKFA